MAPTKKVNNGKYCKKYKQRNLNEIRKNDKERKKFELEHRKYCEYEKHLRNERKEKTQVELFGI